MSLSPSKAKRPTQAKIVLSAEELEAIRSLARERGMALTTFIRVAVKDKVRRITEGKE